MRPNKKKTMLFHDHSIRYSGEGKVFSTTFMKDFRDYYESLGVSQSATADELKTAYRRAARRYHPDLNPGDVTAEEKFKEIGEAYEILSDSDRRSEYDQFTQFLENQQNPTKGLFNRGKKGAKDYSQFKDFSMFVDYLLNRRGEANSPADSSASSASPTASPTQSPPSPSASTQKQASKRTAATTQNSQAQGKRPKPTGNTQQPNSSGEAVRRTIQNPSTRSTETFNKRSVEPRSPQAPSSSQKGDRRNPNSSNTATRRTSQNPKSKTQNSITEAQLTLPLNKAYKGGKERIRLADGRSLTVVLPPAMLSGQTIQVTAQESSPGMDDGDRLSLLIQVAPHDFFTLEMPDIHCTIPITPCEAILGGPISIPTLDGSVKMVVPAGARSGQKLRLPDKGYPFDGQRGDQIVELEIQMPTTITPRERELYEKIRLTESFRPRKTLYF